MSHHRAAADHEGALQNKVDSCKPAFRGVSKKQEKAEERQARQASNGHRAGKQGKGKRRRR